MSRKLFDGNMEIKPLMPLMIVITILLVFGINITMMTFKTSSGIDFYQSWGVSKAQQWSNGVLKSPYTELLKYDAVLDSYSDYSNDPRLHLANQINHQLNPNGLDLIGTPLFYAMFAFMPQEYSLAFGIFQAARIILFISAIILLFTIKRGKWFLYIAISIILVLHYEPLLLDLRVGNVNSFQFFTIVALIFCYDRFLKHCSIRRAFVLGTIFMCFLVLLILFKPNIILIALILSASLWALHGSKVFALSATIAGLFGVMLMAFPCLYFGSWMVWTDWYGYLFHSSEKLFYPVSRGNYATTLLVSDTLNVSVNATMALIVTLLITSGLWVLFMTRLKHEPVLKYLQDRISGLLRDPYLCASLGITVTLACSPLVWMHYYLLSLFPALWLIAISPRWSYTELLGVLSIILTSDFLPFLFGWHKLERYTVACGLIPLWLGILTVVAGRVETSKLNLAKA